MKKNILITGGAGFIGSHVNKMLKKANYHTIVLDDLSRGNSATLPNTVFYEGNINDKQLLNSILQKHKIDAVMHFAAYIDVGESVKNPTLYFENNYHSTTKLLDCLLENSIKYFIFSSSASIFGVPQNDFIDETHALQPINPYGESKLLVEKTLNELNNKKLLKSCCLRYFNAAGGDVEGEIKNFQPHVTNLIPIILKKIKNNELNISIFGTDYPTYDGTCIRDYIHIEDLGSAHILGMEKLFLTNQSSAYNLGNGKGYSVKEVIQAVEKVVNKKINIIECARREGDPARLVANSTKANIELNWYPRFSKLEEMIEHAWKAIN